MFVMSRMTFRRASVAAVIAIVGLLMTMSPAWAAGSGVTTGGYSDINQSGNPEVPLCLRASSITINLFNVGTFNNSAGPFNTEAEFKSTGPFYFGPQGTFSDSECTVPSAVSGTLTVSGDVTCGKVVAEYQRVGSEYVIQTTSPTTCTIAADTDNTETSNLRFTGEQLACTGDPATDPCGPQDSNSKEFTGVYAQGG